MDIYGSCYRLSNTLLTRIIALCLVIADQFFKRYETNYFGDSNYSCPMQIFPLIDVLSISSFKDSVSFCSGWVSDTVLASALQFFIKITFEVLTSEIVELNIIACIHVHNTLVKVPGSKTKHKMLILAPTWLCEDPKLRSHRILRMINESWSPGHDPLLPTPSLSSIHPRPV